MCTHNFVHRQLVCRLPCRHMFHGHCLENHQLQQKQHRGRARNDCPSCGGSGRITAIWKCIAAALTTQKIFGEQFPNLIGITADRYGIGTPRLELDQHLPEHARKEPTAASSRVGESRGYVTSDEPPTHKPLFRTQDERSATILDPDSAASV